MRRCDIPFFSPPTENTRGRETFDPPKNAAEMIGRVLMRHYQPTARGQFVLKRDGVWETLSAATQEELDAADEVFQGGHVYEITDEMAEELENAGYEVTE